MIYRKTPSWAAFSSMGLGFAVSLYSLLAPFLGQESLNYQERALGVSVMSVTGFFVGRIFWNKSPDKERARINAFFTMLRTPIDFAREVGQGNDRQQARVIGGFGLALGLCMTPLFFICKDARSIISLSVLIVLVAGICGGLFSWGLKKEKGTDHE